MARKPGHEACRACTTCGYGWCPDCDDEGVICHCGLGPVPIRATSVDVPLYRPRPRRRQSTGSPQT
jgi:hypothetical protein